jgi:hypothetical protein
MELLLLFEVEKRDSRAFGNKIKAFLDQVRDDRVEGQLLGETQSPDARSREKVGRRRQKQWWVSKMPAIGERYHPSASLLNGLKN